MLQFYLRIESYLETNHFLTTAQDICSTKVFLRLLSKVSYMQLGKIQIQDVWVASCRGKEDFLKIISQSVL